MRPGGHYHVVVYIMAIPRAAREPNPNRRLRNCCEGELDGTRCGERNGWKKTHPIVHAMHPLAGTLPMGS